MHSQFRPNSCVPDLSPELAQPNQLLDALNVHIGVFSPNGGYAVRRRLGNEELVNPLLPESDTNITVGWTWDVPGRRLFFANCDPADELHAIYEFRLDSDGNPVFTTLIEGADLAFTTGTELSMRYFGGFLTFTALNIPEPRFINVARALDGEYATWTLVDIAQLRRPPALPPQIYGVDGVDDTDVFDIAIHYPKPFPDSTLQGYQFAYNYEYLDYMESRLSDWSPVNWNNGPYLILPEQEFYDYMGNGDYATLTPPTTPNPQIVAVRFYYRLGNTGTPTYFKRILNTVPNWLNIPADDPQCVPAINTGYNFGFILPAMDELFSIGAPTNLLAADGIPRYARDEIFGDNRAILGNFKEGYTFEFPDLPTVNVEFDTPTVNDMKDRAYRIFPPLIYKLDLALLFKDEYGRPIGTQGLGAYTLPIHDTYTVNQFDINTIGPGVAYDSATWQEVVDYFNNNPGPTVPYGFNSNSDALNALWFDIFYGGAALPSEVGSVELISRPHQAVSQFMRTLSFPFFIYGSPEMGFKLMLDNIQETRTIDSVQYSFYGLGFCFRSGEPINFSTEQNYYIQVRGQTFPDTSTGGGSVYNFDVDKQYKITDQSGNILISRQPYESPTLSRYYLSAFPHGDWQDNGSTKGFYHSILDVVLYSPTLVPPTIWNTATLCKWTAAEYESGLHRQYYGDSFFTADEKQTSSFRAEVFVDNASGGVDRTNYDMGLISWQGYFASMNLNGIYLETWDSDQGQVVVLDPNPREVHLTTRMRHGEQYFTDTLINRLFQVNPLNETNIQGTIGAITKLTLLATASTDGQNVYAVCEAGAEMIYLGKTQLNNTNGTSNVAASTLVFGTHNTLQLPYGTDSQALVVETLRGLVFYFDNEYKKLVQIAADGQNAISDQKEFMKHADALPGNCIGFDPSYKEISVVGGAASSAPGLAYNFEKDIYQGRRDFGPDDSPTELLAFMSTKRAAGSNDTGVNQFYGFSKGKMYRYNSPGSQTINGAEFQDLMEFMLNMNPDMLKRMGSVQILSSNQSTFNVDMETDTGLLSQIPSSAFELREGMQFAPIRQASNTTGGLFDGANMHGYLMQLLLSSDADSEKFLTFVRVNFMESPTNQR